MVLVLCQWLSCKKIRLACRNTGVRITNFTVFFSLPLALTLECTGLYWLASSLTTAPRRTYHTHLYPSRNHTPISTPSQLIQSYSFPPSRFTQSLISTPHSSRNHTHLHPRSSHNYTHHPLTVHTITATSTPSQFTQSHISPLTAHIMTLPSPPLTTHTITLISTPSQLTQSHSISTPSRFTQSLISALHTVLTQSHSSLPLTAQSHSHLHPLTVHTHLHPSQLTQSHSSPPPHSSHNHYHLHPSQLTQSLISTLTAHTITLPSPQLTLSLISILTSHTITLPSPPPHSSGVN